MNIIIDKSRFDGWDPKYSQIEYLARCMRIEIDDFITGIETGIFHRSEKSDYTARCCTKDDLKTYLFENGIEEDRFTETKSMGRLSRLSSYSSSLDMSLSEMTRSACGGKKASGKEFTPVVSIPGEDGYYESCIDGFFLGVLFLMQRSALPLSYLDTAFGKCGWNPRVTTLCGLTSSVGMEVHEFLRLTESDGDICFIPSSPHEAMTITIEDIRAELSMMLGAGQLSLIAAILDMGKTKVYQDFLRKSRTTFTLHSLLPYIHHLRISLSELFLRCYRRKCGY